MGFHAAHDEVLDEHYGRMADRYDSYLSYSGDFVETLSREIVAKLRLGADDHFVDLGGGTGLYTAAILDRVPLRHRPVLVDPFPAMLDRVPDELPVRKVAQSAEEWAADAAVSSERVDKVLMKESIHHVEAQGELLGDLHACLAPGGAICLVHIPPDIEYPLFDAALERSRTWHADPVVLERHVKAAGFDVERDLFEYRHRIPRAHYLQMVRDRYMSVLSSFTPEEIEAGVAEIDARYADTEVLEFTDRFECITGRKA